MTIEWNDDLRTGIVTIDEQHQLLFETINKLDKFKKTKSNFSEILLDLQSYVLIHFCTEEKYMKCIDYPGYSQHKLCHDKFVSDIENILVKINSPDDFMDIAAELVIFVEQWIQDHYSSEDVKMASYINKNNLNNNFL